MKQPFPIGSKIRYHVEMEGLPFVARVFMPLGSEVKVIDLQREFADVPDGFFGVLTENEQYIAFHESQAKHFLPIKESSATTLSETTRSELIRVLRMNDNSGWAEIWTVVKKNRADAEQLAVLKETLAKLAKV